MDPGRPDSFELLCQYWDRVTINSFSISLLIAFTLQVLLKFTISLEH